MEVKRGYKMTEVGVIPKDWKITRLVELVRHGPKNGYSGRSGSGAGGTPTLSLSATTSGRLILNKETVKYLEQRIPFESNLFLKTDDILVQRSNTIDLVGTTAIYSGPSHTYVYPDLMMRLRFHDRISALWFWRYANSFGGRLFFTSVAAGSTGSMPKISGETLRRMPVPIPSTKAEQEAIAEALSDADALIESLEQLIAKKRQLKQGAMQELLTGKRRLPGFDGKWETHAFSSIFEILRNGSNSRSDLSEHGEVGYLHYGDIHVHASVSLDCAVQLKSFISANKVSHLPSMQDGDLVMADASEDTVAIGKAVEICNLDGRRTVAGLHTLLLRPRMGYLAQGFTGYLPCLPSVRSALVRMATGVSVYGISKTNVKAIEVTIPQSEEQAAIAIILSDMDSEITALETKLAKARQIKQGMMQELLTGRIRLV